MENTNNSLYRYTKNEDIANSISHLFGALLSLALLIYTLNLELTQTQYFTICIYGITLIGMFLTSGLYHGIYSYQYRLFLKKMDHSFIFLLITATYVPLVVNTLQTTLSYFILAILIICTVIGIIMKFKYVGRYKKISTLIYVLMGWLVIFMIPALLDNMTKESLLYLLAGGLAYTFGAVIYALTNFKYHHFIWHLFVLSAAMLQFIAIITTLKY